MKLHNDKLQLNWMPAGGSAIVWLCDNNINANVDDGLPFPKGLISGNLGLTPSFVVYNGKFRLYSYRLHQDSYLEGLGVEI